MFTRNQLAHLVFWATQARAKVDMIDPDGAVVGSTKVTTPLRGSDLARCVPEKFTVEPVGCLVVTLSGDIRVGTRGEFDTAVVTDRDKPSLEERFLRLERRERRREQRERDLAAQNERLLAEREERQNEEVVEQDETPVEPTPEGSEGDASRNAPVSQGEGTGGASGSGSEQHGAV